MPRLRWPGVGVVVLSAALVASACGDDTSEQAQPQGVPVVVVTTGIWADVVDNIACQGGVRIEQLVPTGGDPHSYEPSMADRATTEDAVLVVANGLALEEGLDDTLDAVEGDGTPVFRVAEHVDAIEYAGGHDDEHDDHAEDDPHGHEGDDPHVWFDPIRVAGVLPELGDELAARAGLDAGEVADCVDRYASALAEVDAEISALVQSIPAENRKLVTSHDSLGYFADRYGFDLVATVSPASSGLAEMDLRHLDELKQVLEATGVRAIFAETQHSSDDAETLADQLEGVEVVTLYTGSLGEPGSGADTYIGLLRTNATLIAEALA
ncbi:MAG: metal ABC transporter substrate-binding protein [Acidimicrobiales bacterium]